MSNNRAVIALLDQAQTDNDSGHREAAGSSLERALRIEPRNPWLWLELAQLRLAQGQYAQAITLAGKANSFAGHDTRVQAANWQVIGQARVALGDSAGAEQAFKLSADLAQQAKADNDSDSNLK
jgi:predicted Zn-dependent protease